MNSVKIVCLFETLCSLLLLYFKESISLRNDLLVSSFCHLLSDDHLRLYRMTHKMVLSLYIISVRIWKKNKNIRFSHIVKHILGNFYSFGWYCQNIMSIIYIEIFMSITTLIFNFGFNFTFFSVTRIWLPCSNLDDLW